MVKKRDPLDDVLDVIRVIIIAVVGFVVIRAVVLALG